MNSNKWRPLSCPNFSSFFLSNIFTVLVFFLIPDLQVTFCCTPVPLPSIFWASGTLIYLAVLLSSSLGSMCLCIIFLFWDCSCLKPPSYPFPSSTWIPVPSPGRSGNIFQHFGQLGQSLPCLSQALHAKVRSLFWKCIKLSAVTRFMHHDAGKAAKARLHYKKDMGWTGAAMEDLGRSAAGRGIRYLGALS